MAKRTEEDAYARVEQLRTHPEEGRATKISMPKPRVPDDVSAAEWSGILAAEALREEAREANRHRVRKAFGDEVYRSLEEQALNARNDLVIVLEQCGVNFTRETFNALGHVTIGIMNNAALAAIAVLDREKD